MFTVKVSGVFVILCAALSAVHGSLEESRPNEFRFQAVIDSTDPNKGPLPCAGVVLAEYWVVTVASCLANVRAESLQVYTDRRVYNNPGTTNRVANSYQHEQFANGNPANDIALLKTSEKIVITDSVTRGPVAPSNAKIPDPLLASFIQFNLGTNYPNVMQRVEYRIYSGSNCTNKDGSLMTIPKGSACGQDTRDPKSTVVSKGAPITKSGILFALVSEYRATEKETVTLIPYHLNWILKQAGPNSGIKIDGTYGTDGTGGAATVSFSASSLVASVVIAMLMKNWMVTA